MASKSVTKKKTNETIKREFLNLLLENDDVGKQGLNKTANNVNNSQEAILRRYKDIIKAQNKKAIKYIGSKANQQYILKFHLNNFLKKYPLLKNPPYNPVILKTNLRLSNCLQRKPRCFLHR